MPHSAPSSCSIPPCSPFLLFPPSFSALRAACFAAAIGAATAATRCSREYSGGVRWQCA